tara:strand:+ start:2445 stop:2585 length:141 start_codon:yes stop_codon:yes gene_type:complete
MFTPSYQALPMSRAVFAIVAANVAMRVHRDRTNMLLAREMGSDHSP